MLETLDAEPLFYPLSKGDPCKLFSPCFWCHDYNTQPRKQLFEHLRVKKKKKKSCLWGAASCAAIMNWLNLYILMLCWFLCQNLI